MQIKLTIFLIVILFTTNIFTIEAQSSKNVKVKLITSSIDIHPGGSFWIAAEFEMLNNWHIYWRNSGDSGLPTTISWQLPEGFKVSKTFYPYPQILIEGNSATYIYENKVILFAEVTAPDKIERDSIMINAKINWLECKKACLPGSADLSKTINIDNSKPQDAPMNNFFVDQLKNIPIYKSDWEIYSRLYNSKVIIQGLKPNWFDAADYQVFFYPYNDITFNHSADQNFKTNENGFELSVELNNFRIADPAELNGILVITESWEKGQKRKSLELNSIINN